MNYSVVFSSRTGNTKMLADTVTSHLSGLDFIYTGIPADEASEADFILQSVFLDR